MKLKSKTGRIVETDNEMVIEQLIKYGAVPIQDKPKAAPKPPLRKGV